MVWVERAKLGELSLKHRLPSIWGGAAYLDTGGLASKAIGPRCSAVAGADLQDPQGHQGDLAFEQGSKLELVVNQKGARTLRITIPASVLLSADEVIE